MTRGFDVKPALDLPDEAVEERGELLRLGMVRQFGGDGHVGAVRPASASRMVPRLVCSMAHPSLLTAVTAMLSVVPSLSHGTTMALTWPCPRANSSIARDTTLGDPLATNSIVQSCNLQSAMLATLPMRI